MQNLQFDLAVHGFSYCRCWVHGWSNLWVNPERAFGSWKTVHFYDGVLATEVRYKTLFHIILTRIEDLTSKSNVRHAHPLPFCF